MSVIWTVRVRFNRALFRILSHSVFQVKIDYSRIPKNLAELQHSIEFDSQLRPNYIEGPIFCYIK